MQTTACSGKAKWKQPRKCITYREQPFSKSEPTQQSFQGHTLPLSHSLSTSTRRPLKFACWKRKNNQNGVILDHSKPPETGLHSHHSTPSEPLFAAIKNHWGRPHLSSWAASLAWSIQLQYRPDKGVLQYLLCQVFFATSLGHWYPGNNLQSWCSSWQGLRRNKPYGCAGTWTVSKI